MNELATVNRSTGLTHTSARPLTFGGRLTDLLSPGTPPADVHPDIRVLFEPLAPKLSPLMKREDYTITVSGFWGPSYHKAQRDAVRSSSELFQEFAAKYQLVEQSQAEVGEWIRAAVATNVEFRNVPDAPKDPADVLKNGSVGNLLDSFMKPLPWRSPSDLATKPVAEQHDVLCTWLKDSFCTVAQAMALALDGFSGLEMLGKVIWKTEKVCDLVFYRWIVEESVVAVRRTPGAVRTEDIGQEFLRQITEVHGQRDVVRTLKHQLQLHALQNVRTLPWDDTTVAMPDRVRRLLQKAPALLRPMVKIIVGEEIGRRILERDVHTEERTDHFTEKDVRLVQRPVYVPFDPAVVIGDFILCGWSPEEASR